MFDFLKRRRIASENEGLRLRLERNQLLAAARASDHRREVSEHAYNLWSTIVDPNDEFEGWLRADATYWGTGDKNRDRPVSLDEQRYIMRRIAGTSGVLRNIIRNTQAYVVGTGLTHSFEPPPESMRAGLSDSAWEEAANAARAWWSEFHEREKFHRHTKERLKFLVREGEHGWRFFNEGFGRLSVRLLDPGSIKSDDSVEWPDGIIFDPVDQQKVVAYLVNGERVPAEEVDFRKEVTDSDVHRGEPVGWVCRVAIVRADKILRNIGKLTEVQSAIAMVQQRKNSLDGAARSNALDGQTDKSHSNDPSVSRTIRQQRFETGAIVETGPNVDLHFPVTSSAITQFVAGLSADLRYVAATFNFPEHMLTADASNNNFASILMAAAPSTKEFEGAQVDLAEDCEAVQRRVIETGVAAGQLPAACELLEMKTTGPQVESVNRLDEAKRKEIEKRNRVLSSKTWQKERGLDPEEEIENIAADRDRSGDGLGLNPPPGNLNRPGDDGEGGGDDDDT